MTYSELEAYVYELLGFFTADKGIAVTPDADLRGELFLSSMDAVDIYTDLTEQYDVELITDIRGYGTPDKLCQAVWQEINHSTFKRD